MLEYEALIKSQKSQEYSKILQSGPLKVLEEPKFNLSEYFKANTKNAVEIDTYITDPKARKSGIARIIVYEGLKKHIERHFKDEKNSEIYLCSTLHRDNYSSKPPFRIAVKNLSLTPGFSLFNCLSKFLT